MAEMHPKEGTEQGLADSTHKIEMDTPDPGYGAFPVSIMDRSTIEVMTFDPSEGKPATISYRLNKAGCIRIRLVLRQMQALVIRTLQDWTEQPFGKYQLQWDGRDSSGNVVDNKRMFVLFEAQDQGRGRQHLKHDEKLCRDPLIVIDPPPGPLCPVKDTLKFTAGLHPSTLQLAKEHGCEIRCYVDYRLFKTERVEACTGRFDLTVDTGSLDNGPHLITINIDDLHDHVGSGGLKIDVEN